MKNLDAPGRSTFFFLLAVFFFILSPSYSFGQANPCAPKKAPRSQPNPCAARNPCAPANPCAANPCAVNPCAAANPCAPGRAAASRAKAVMARGEVLKVDSKAQRLLVKAYGKEINLGLSKYAQVREGTKIKSLGQIKPGDRVTVSYVDSGNAQTAWYIYLAAGAVANPCAANPCAANPCAPKVKRSSPNPCAVNPCAVNPCAPKASKRR